MPEFKLKTLINRSFKPIKFSRNGKPHYQIYLEVEAPEDFDLKTIKSVEYTLHPTFKKRLRTSNNPRDNFRIEIKAWGIFVVNVNIEFVNGETAEFSQNMKENMEDCFS